MLIKSTLSLLLLSLTAFDAPRQAIKLPVAVSGDYVEARTASVFAGPCHYNGELVTEGRQAILAWDITAGRWKGVDLAGVCVMASIKGDDNLGEQSGDRSTELLIDRSATDAQVAAVVELIQARSAAQLGHIFSPQRANIVFTHNADGYVVNAAGFGSMTVHPMPNNECCTQPHLVWYEPLVPLQHRKVGYTEVASYDSQNNGDPWQRSDENSAFYGTFTFDGK